MYLVSVHNILNHSQLISEYLLLSENLTKPSLRLCDKLSLSHAPVFNLDLCSLWQFCSLGGSSNLSGQERRFCVFGKNKYFLPGVK